MPDKPKAVRVPRESVNDSTVKLVSWLAKEGQRLEAGQATAEIETSKAVIEMRAPESGCLRRRQTEGAEIRIGAVLFYLTAEPLDPLPEESEEAPVSSAGSRFSQKAQALIEEHGLDPAAFAGLGLVRENDVLEFMQKRGGGGKAAMETSGTPTRREALPRRKITEIGYLSAGQNGGLASSISLLCATRGLRELARKRAEWGGSLTPVIIFETARLLREHPVFNAFYEENTAHYYESVNVGLAIDAGLGLKVPVLRDADRKDIGALARELQDILLEYSNDEFDVAALSGGTFTITDLSSEEAFGITPLINHRQAAILAIGGEFTPPGADSAVFQMTLTFDHRLTEGRAAAVFLRELRNRLRSYEEKSP